MKRRTASQELRSSWVGGGQGSWKARLVGQYELSRNRDLLIKREREDVMVWEWKRGNKQQIRFPEKSLKVWESLLVIKLCLKDTVQRGEDTWSSS